MQCRRWEESVSPLRWRFLQQGNHASKDGPQYQFLHQVRMHSRLPRPATPSPHTVGLMALVQPRHCAVIGPLTSTSPIVVRHLDTRAPPPPLPPPTLPPLRAQLPYTPPASAPR